MSRAMQIVRYLIPRISLVDLPWMLGVAAAGSLLAGLYGIGHDQLTYSISPEYFTKMKFEQFHYADFGFGNRVFVATIGFLASWWVGAIAAWLLARRLIPGQPRGVAIGQIVRGFLVVLVVTFLFGFAGYVVGIWRGPEAGYSRWQTMIGALDIEQPWLFVRVATIHTGSYLGGLVGLIFALLLIRPVESGERKTLDSTKSVRA